jgi:hypothetical protein
MGTIGAIILIAVCVFAVAGLGMLIDWVFPPKEEPRSYEARRPTQKDTEL